MISKTPTKAVDRYLALMDDQREKTYAALAGITPEQLWQRPAHGEWSIGEILHHNILVIQSLFPFVRLAWRWFQWYGRMFSENLYKTEIEDPYRKKGYPHWEGFLWAPRYSSGNQVPFSLLYEKTLKAHQEIRKFYTDKYESVLGHIYFLLPVFGKFNLIQALRIGVYHDQLHYDDVIKQWEGIKNTRSK